MPASAKPKNPELAAAWKVAEAAMLRYKASLDPTDKMIAAEKLWLVAREEAKIIARTKIDTKLPANKRRDQDELGEMAVSSVLASRDKHFTLLSEKFDPAKASLRTYMQRIIFNKLTDYVRKEPIPGVIGRGTAKAATTLANEPRDEISSLKEFASSLAPRSEPGHLAHADEAVAEDDHATLQLFAHLGRFLSEDECEVFACEVYEMTHEEGLSAINQKRADENREALTMDDYRDFLASADVAMAKHYPEYGLSKSQQALAHDDKLQSAMAELTMKEAEVFDCAHLKNLTNDQGLAHLCALHGAREGPDGKMYPHMSLSDYKRKLKSAREIIAKLLPEYPL